MTDDLNLQDYLEDFTPEELEVARGLINSKNQVELENLHKHLYRVPCPSPQEFIDDWVGYEIKKGLFPWVIKTFVELWDYEENFSESVLYGATRCHGKDVPIKIYGGGIKMVQDVKVGDILVGDDFEPRNVLEIVSGVGPLYKVNQSWGMNYTVNNIHKLVLISIESKKIFEVPTEEYIKWPKEFS